MPTAAVTPVPIFGAGISLIKEEEEEVVEGCQRCSKMFKGVQRCSKVFKGVFAVAELTVE
jgi:hypothetical protein